MERGSKLREVAKRALPERLRRYRAAITEAARADRRPRLPRFIQRQNRLAAKEAQALRVYELQRRIDQAREAGHAVAGA